MLFVNTMVYMGRENPVPLRAFQVRAGFSLEALLAVLSPYNPLSFPRCQRACRPLESGIITKFLVNSLIEFEINRILLFIVNNFYNNYERGKSFSL